MVCWWAVVMCNMLNNGFVTGLLWSAGAGVVMCKALNNGFVTGRFKRLPLLCFQYMPQHNKGSLYRGASLSLWWYTYYIIGGCGGLYWPSRLALSSCWCCITSTKGCKQPSPSTVSLFFINRKSFAVKCPFSISQ